MFSCQSTAAFQLLGSLSLYSVGGGAAPRASVSSPHRSSNKGPTLYCTLHLQCYKASTPGFDKVVLGRARRWIFGSWLVGLLPCLLVLRHARVPWSCLLVASVMGRPRGAVMPDARCHMRQTCPHCGWICGINSRPVFRTRVLCCASTCSLSH